MNLVGVPAVAFQLTGDRDNPNVSTYEEQHPTLPANPMSDRGAAVAFREDQRTGPCFETEVPSGIATGGGKPGEGYPCVAFKPSHFTRGKDGAPSEAVPPLSADADKGDQDPVVAYAPDIAATMVARSSRGQGQSNSPGHNADKTCVAFTERTREAGRTVETQEGLAYSLNNPGKGGRAQERCIAQGMVVRRLTPTECERLQGFPDGWTEGVSDSARYRMLGNAVTVNVAEWIARRIVYQSSNHLV